MFLDSHCHLTDKAFVGRTDQVLSDAQQEGVGLFLTIGWDLPSSQEVLAFSQKHGNVYCAVGLHPENLEMASAQTLNQIRQLAKDPKVKAIGEIGLDYHWYKETKDRENQKRWFIAQIDLANELNLPISIHAREALGDTLAILQEHPLKRGGVLHCYSGSAEMLIEFAKLGFYFGFDGPITYKNAIEPKKCVELCPLDRLLSETDSPYLPPTPHRGETNEPKFVPLIVAQMAEIKHLPIEIVKVAIEGNFRKLFSVEQ